MADNSNPHARAGRMAKAIAMAAVIDSNFIRQNPRLDPFDQAARIRLASFAWSDEVWEAIGASALKPNGERYEHKPISEETRAMIREIYEGRSKAPLAQRRAG